MTDSLEELGARILRCTRCERHYTRRLAVPGEGDPDPGIMLIGEAPGVKENETGKPFVGRAGRYLEKVLEQNGFSRQNLFVTSILKCFHPRRP